MSILCRCRDFPADAAYGDDARLFRTADAYDAGLLRCLRGAEALFKVPEDVIDMLGSYGEADGILVNTGCRQLFRGHLRVCCIIRMNDKTLDICHICEKREHLQSINKSIRFFLTTLNIEGKNGPSAIREICFIQCVLGMIRQ